MKSMLIAATVVGAAIAGFILYIQQKEKPLNYLKEAGKDTNRNLKEIFEEEQPLLNTMG